MKTAALLLLAFGLMVAVLDGGLRAWDQEAAAREAVDRCLFAGGTPADCLEVLP
jgi:3-mercaptopyruvate sulfurtransferase SseA